MSMIAHPVTTADGDDIKHERTLTNHCNEQIGPERGTVVASGLGALVGGRGGT